MGLVYNPIHNRKDNMITQIILRFEDLPDEQRTEICHNLLSEMRYEDLDFKLFYKNGGINKPMIEVKNAK